MTLELIEVGTSEFKIPENVLYKNYIQKNHLNDSWAHMNFAATLSSVKNRAIANSSADISIISDDGLYYTKDLVENISLLHKENPEQDIILFYAAKFRNQINRSYFNTVRAISLNDIQFLHEFEISFKVESIKGKGILFCENFGLGGKFPFFENKVFVAEAVKQGLNVIAIPGSFKLYSKELYWEKELSSIRQKSLGAALCKIYGLKYIHQYVDISMNRLIKDEKANNRINDWSIAKIELLLKGAYEYLNFKSDGKYITH